MCVARSALWACLGLLTHLGPLVTCKLLPVTVQEPVFTTSTVVRVLNAQLGNKLRVLKNGVNFGSATCATGDGVYGVTLDTSGLRTGDQLTAIQEDTQGDSSEPSEVSVFVTDPPPLRTPQIASSLTTCSFRILLVGLTPGAEIVFIYSGQQVGNALPVVETEQSFDLPQQVDPGDTLVVKQTLGGDSLSIESDPVSLAPGALARYGDIIPPSVFNPEKPDVVGGLTCGLLNVGLEAIPSLQSTIINGDHFNYFLNVGQQFTQPLGFPLQVGDLTWNQTYDLACESRPVTSVFEVGPPVVPSPVIETAGCKQTPRMVVSDILPGAKVTVFGNGQPIGETTAGSEPFLDLPLKAIEDLGPTPTLTVQQEVCGVTAASAGVTFDQPEADITQSPALSLLDVTACATAVYVDVSLFPATYLRRLRVIDAGIKVPASKTIQLIGTLDIVMVSLLQPASANQELQAILDTCSTTYASPVLTVQNFIKPAPMLLPVAPYQPYLYVLRVPAGVPVSVYFNTYQITALGPGYKSKKSLQLRDDVTEIQVGIVAEIFMHNYPGAPTYSQLNATGNVTVVQRGCEQFSKARQSSTQSIAKAGLAVSYSPQQVKINTGYNLLTSATADQARIPAYSPIFQRAGEYTLDNLVLRLGQSYNLLTHDPNGGVGNVLATPDSPAFPFKIGVYVPPPPPPPSPPPPPAHFVIIIRVLHLQYGLVDFYGELLTLWHVIGTGHPFGVSEGFTVQAAVNGKAGPVVTDEVDPPSFTTFPQPKTGEVIEGRFTGSYFDNTATLPLPGGYVSILYSGQSTVYFCMLLYCEDTCTVQAYQGSGGCPQAGENLVSTNHTTNINDTFAL